MIDKSIKKRRTLLSRNKGILGDSIEIMVERLMEGEGEAGIEDRDLVYNDSEADMVNPITNIRSDKMELMLEEKIGYQEYQRAKMHKVEEEESTKDNDSTGSE